MKRILIILILLASGALGFLFSWYKHPETPRPHLTQTFHYPTLFVAQLKNDPAAGQKIYQEYCANCHAPEPIIDIHAPRINDKKAWQLRRQRGIAALLKTTINGIGAMPARGGCFECSDAQLRETLTYILAVSQ